MGTLTFSPSLYIGMAYFFESTFRISVFLGFSEKMAILGVGSGKTRNNSLIPLQAQYGSRGQLFWTIF